MRDHGYPTDLDWPCRSGLKRQQEYTSSSSKGLIFGSKVFKSGYNAVETCHYSIIYSEPSHPNNLKRRWMTRNTQAYAACAGFDHWPKGWIQLTSTTLGVAKLSRIALWILSSQETKSGQHLSKVNLAMKLAHRAQTKRILESLRISRHAIKQSLQYLDNNAESCNLPPPKRLKTSDPCRSSQLQWASLHLQIFDLLVLRRHLDSGRSWMILVLHSQPPNLKLQPSLAAKTPGCPRNASSQMDIKNGQRLSQYFFSIYAYITYQWHITIWCRAVVLSCFGLWNDSRDMSFTSVCLD